ncbi:hypothetical protein F5B20DRAFT_594138 [Whalleya microplaca]|nr:hypothetical protein F5B20DRAFT_594138 [Whalleya microplaca]
MYLNVDGLVRKSELAPGIAADRGVTPVPCSANANRIRECAPCRQWFIKAFRMPETWWSDHCRNSNGYLGSEMTKDDNTVTGFNTWAYFEIKHLGKRMEYRWDKINTFIRLLASPRRTIAIFFDVHPSIEERIRNVLLCPELPWLNDPFWIYARLAEEITPLVTSAAWAIRDHVRGIEEEIIPTGRPQPKYRQLHDIARHAIHVSETLDVTSKTMEGIIAQHHDFLNQGFTAEKSDLNSSENIGRQLHSWSHMISSLHYRSVSNKDRLQNEIQLSFNIAAQHDTAISVEIGRAAQADSSAMKTIAFFTMAFLPATFLSSIFSTSFFNYSADIWNVSDQFWIYWAFVIPTTLVAFASWFFWHKIFPVTSVLETPSSISNR